MKNNLPIILLSGALIKDNNRYLLVQEAHDKTYSKCKDKWTLPHGSYDKQGESILDLASREILEETGGTVKFTGNHICLEGYSKIQNRVILICITHLAYGWEKIQERLDNEIKDVKYFIKEEIIEMHNRGEIRDDIPIITIIKAFEKEQRGIIRWGLNI
jgi:ADP-ribose pyrophosphatase YjhB (NUDIX family)